MIINIYYRIIEANFGKAPLTYVSLEKVISKLGHPSKPVDTLTSLPDSCHIRGEAATDVSYDVPSLKGRVV